MHYVEPDVFNDIFSDPVKLKILNKKVGMERKFSVPSTLQTFCSSPHNLWHVTLWYDGQQKQLNYLTWKHSNFTSALIAF